MKTVTFLLIAVLASPAVNQYLTGKIQEKHLLEQRQLLLKDVFACNEQPKVSLRENLKLLYHCLRGRIIHCDRRQRKSMQAAQFVQDKNHTYCTCIIHTGVDTSHQHKTITIQILRNFMINIDFFLFDFEWHSLVYHGLSVSEFVQLDMINMEQNLKTEEIQYVSLSGPMLLGLIKYIHKGTASTMTGYMTPKCQNNGLYYIPNKNQTV